MIAPTLEYSIYVISPLDGVLVLLECYNKTPKKKPPKHHRLCGLYTINISHTSGDWEVEDKASVDSISHDSLLPGSQMSSHFVPRGWKGQESSLGALL